MIRALIFGIVSVYCMYVSWQNLLRPGMHGFYRFFAWELIAALIALNAPYWMNNPFSSISQVIASLFLLTSIFLLVHGVYLLKVFGKPDKNRTDEGLLAFEKTSRLVTVGVYKYIRHPLYSSLLFLAWGAFFKHLSWFGLLLAVSASLFLVITAKKDEDECLLYFGNTYHAYMQGTKRFIPFIV